MVLTNALLAIVMTLVISPNSFGLPKRFQKGVACSLSFYSPVSYIAGLKSKEIRDWEQKQASPKALQDLAIINQPALKQIMKKAEFDLSFTGAELLGPVLKSTATIKTKGARKNKPPRQIFDYLRTTLKVDSVAAIYKALEYFENYHEIGRLKDYISAPKANGYRGIHFSIRLASGYMAEIQLHIKSLYEAKTRIGGADEIYAIARELEREVKLLKDKPAELLFFEKEKQDLERFLNNPKVAPNEPTIYQNRYIKPAAYQRYILRQLAKTKKKIIKKRELEEQLEVLQMRHIQILENAWDHVEVGKLPEEFRRELFGS